MTASKKILVTGAGGYIGGSVVSQLLNPKSGQALQPSDIVGIVRKPDVAEKVRKLGIEVADLDLSNEAEVEAFVVERNVDIIAHFANATDPTIALPLIKALAAQKAKTGKTGHFVHTSGTTSLADVTGWQHGPVKDTDNIYELEKSNEAPYPIRETNVAVYEATKESGIPLSLVVPPFIYGEGSGEGSRLTVITPLQLKSAINLKRVRKDAVRGRWPAVNINDVAAFYTLLIQKILSGEGDKEEVTGYFYPIAHEVDMWDTSEALAQALHKRGLVDQPTVDTWASDEVAAESFGLPAYFIPWIHRGQQLIESTRAQKLGWQPTSDYDKYLATRGDDVDAYIRNTGHSAPQ